MDYRRLVEAVNKFTNRIDKQKHTRRLIYAFVGTICLWIIRDIVETLASLLLVL